MITSVKLKHEMFFVYYSQPMIDSNGNKVGYNGTGWHILHKKSNQFLYDMLYKENRIDFEGNYDNSKDFMLKQISVVK
jgi:hypothetical protein